MLTAMADQDLFSGSVLVAKAGKPVLNNGYGMANYELDVPNSPQSKFRIASITKPFVALAILQLQEKKLLSIDDSICMYVENCPETWKPIKIRHLLSHTSGLQNVVDMVGYRQWKKLPSTPAKLIDTIRDRSLTFAPGKEFSYSNSNYVILGYILEKVAKTSFARYLRLNVLDPIWNGRFRNG